MVNLCGVMSGFKCGRKRRYVTFDATTVFFLGALLYCFPKEGIIAFVGLMCLKFLVRR
jgi:hypothetical protein